MSKRELKLPVHIVAPVLFLLCIMIIGATLGFLTSKDSVTNKLSCGHNTAGIVETYNPPGSMAKGESCTKQVAVRNEGSVPCYVRIFAEITDPDVRNNLSFSINRAAWSDKQSDGYYYYNRILNSGETSEPLFRTVTANSSVSNFGIICYSETVQSYGYSSAVAAFEAIR